MPAAWERERYCAGLSPDDCMSFLLNFAPERSLPNVSRLLWVMSRLDRVCEWVLWGPFFHHLTTTLTNGLASVKRQEAKESKERERGEEEKKSGKISESFFYSDVGYQKEA